MAIRTILIADDDQANRDYLSRAVADLGFRVLHAGNGRQVVEIADSTTLCLVLLDWFMPVMDGMEALVQLRHNPQTRMIPVIMVTAVMTTPENMKMAFDAGVTDFLRKPFVKAELLARIKSVLHCHNFYDETILQKNKQLNTAALQIAQQNEFIKSIFAKLEQFRETIRETDPSLSESIDSMIADNKSKYSAFNWDKFQEQFNSIHQSFFKNLLSRHKGLTPAEMKLCSLLRLNLDTKEIAAITVQTYDSVRVARTRLRNSLSIHNEENLVSYLMQF